MPFFTWCCHVALGQVATARDRFVALREAASQLIWRELPRSDDPTTSAKMSAMASVHDVAKYMRSRGSFSRMKLLKLVYYAQAWSIAWDGEPLFSEAIEAWPQGPVARELWVDMQHGPRNMGDPESLSQAQRETIDEVLRFYGTLGGDDLSELTHLEPPWRQARASLPAQAPSRKPVTADSMKEYFGSLRMPAKRLTEAYERGVRMLLATPPDERAGLLDVADVDADLFVETLEHDA